jgi:hypothetical protein
MLFKGKEDTKTNCSATYYDPHVSRVQSNFYFFRNRLSSSIHASPSSLERTAWCSCHSYPRRVTFTSPFDVVTHWQLTQHCYRKIREHLKCNWQIICNIKPLIREYYPAGHVPRRWLTWSVTALHRLRQNGSRIELRGMGSMYVSIHLSAQSKMNFILSITLHRPEFPMSSLWDVLFSLGPRLHWEGFRGFPQSLQEIPR